MLNKLLRYELKATARTLLPIGGGVLILTLVTGLVNFVLNSQSDLPGMVEFLQALLTFAAGLAMLFTVAACVFVNVQRFYKLLGEQGYLMLSLPVPVWQHIAAKLISACLWSGVCVLYLFLCTGLLFGSFSLPFGWGIQTAAITATDVTAWLLLMVFLVALLMGAYLSCYLACAIGGQFGQQRLLASIVSYFILGFLEQILFTIAVILLVFSSVQMDAFWIVSFVHSLNSFWGMVVVMGGILLAVAALDAIKWAITQWLMTSRLNLA